MRRSCVNLLDRNGRRGSRNGRQGRNVWHSRSERLIARVVPEKDVIKGAKNDSNANAVNHRDCNKCLCGIHHLRHFGRTKIHFFLETCIFNLKKQFVGVGKNATRTNQLRVVRYRIDKRASR